jgi:hypothetical protein
MVPKHICDTLNPVVPELAYSIVGLLSNNVRFFCLRAKIKDTGLPKSWANLYPERDGKMYKPMPPDYLIDATYL